MAEEIDIPLLQERFGGRAPHLRPQSCLNARHRHAGCHLCVDACPTHAITLEERLPELDPDLCVHCGACVTACPTGVFGQTNPAEKALALSVEQLPPTAPLELFCPLGEPSETTHAPVAARVQHGRCLAALTPLRLLELSRDGARSLWLDDRACSACPLARGAHPVIRRVAAAANGLLAAVGRTPSLFLRSESPGKLLDEPIRRPVLDGMRPKVSRRGFFAALRRMAEDRVEQALEEEPAPMLRTAAPVDQRLPQRTPPGRKRLLEHLARLAPAAAPAPPEGEISLLELPFASVRVDPDACSGCGLCARFCPTGALAFAGDVLSLRRPGDPPEPFSLSFRTALCIDCGICAAACPDDAISFADSLPAAALLATEWSLLVEGELVACVECGAPTAAKPGQTPRCYVCRQKRQTFRPRQDEVGLFADLLRRLPGEDA